MKIRAILLSLFCFYCSDVVGQLIVDETTYSIEELVRDVLIHSSCAETSNYSSYTGKQFNINGIGYFNSNGSSFRYTEGVVLSTGRVEDAAGPNDEIYTSGDEDWPGDDDLRAVTGTGNLFNASYIQFDFVPRTNSISFNFLFASEEYSEDFQCTYSDVFAFILTDSNGASTNLAVVPNTSDRVSATTIRPGIIDACGPRNPSFYGGTNGGNSPISFTGQTRSLAARSMVVPGETYTIKLVIADNLDSQLDSAVFLEAGSFSINVSLGEDRTVRNGNALCIGETTSLDATALGALSYKWHKDGNYMPQFDDQPILDVNDEGSYRVEVAFTANCASESRVRIEFVEPPIIANEPLNLNACDVDQNNEESFYFETNKELILGEQDPSKYTISYYKSLTDAENFENPIEQTRPYISKQATEIIYARISAGKNCYKTTSFELKLQQIDLDSSLQDNYVLCIDTNGAAIEPLPLLDTGLSSTEYIFKWYKNGIENENLIIGADGPAHLATEIGNYLAVLQHRQYQCEILLQTKVESVEPPSSIEVVYVSDFFSNNNTVEIEVKGKSTYQIAIDDGPFSSTSRFEQLIAGEHTAYVTDTQGCSVLTKKFLIVDYPRFFSPNGDGINDEWNIVGLSQIENAEIKIFDRYGKLLYQMLNNNGWDGTNGESQLPSSDYWFSIAYTQNGLKKEFRNHFTLKR